MPRHELLSRTETATYLKLKRTTLDVWASRRRGPACVKLGHARSARVLYPLNEIERYLADPLRYRWPARGRKQNSSGASLSGNTKERSK
jgi:hypothetical protein